MTGCFGNGRFDGGRVITNSPSVHGPDLDIFFWTKKAKQTGNVKAKAFRQCHLKTRTRASALHEPSGCGRPLEIFRDRVLEIFGAGRVVAKRGKTFSFQFKREP